MKTVFLVDDDRSLREVMSRRLQKHFFVRAFASPHAALPGIVTDCPDLMISDVQMPGMSGLDLAATVRQAGNRIPIILITGFLTPDVEERARQLSIDHVLEKPIKDYARLSSLISETIAASPDSKRVDLDRLRLRFLAELSHELRTPLTAIKLALDGLFGHQAAALPPAHRRLAMISQRNVDRIIGLVEKQLDLLQIVVGDVAVARRLVDIRDVVADAVQCSNIAPRTSGVDSTAEVDTHAFTDAERLRTVIEHILDSAVEGETVEISIDASADESHIVLEFSNVDLSGSARKRNGDGSPQRDLLSDSDGGIPGTSFEAMATHRIIRSLGGEFSSRSDDGVEYVRLRLPVLPQYHVRTDFVIPVRSLRRAALLSDTRYAFQRCEIGDVGDNGGVGPAERSFFQKCLRTFCEGDALIRGSRKGTYYIALLDRTADEVDAILATIADGATLHEVSDEALETALLRAMVPGGASPDDLLADPEPAR